MSRNVIDELESRWEAYLKFYREGAIYSAFVRLSEIANCLQHGDVSSNVIAKWSEALRRVEPTHDDLSTIGREARHQIARIRQMLNAGVDLTYEEVLLAITVRTELDLLSGFLGDRGVVIDAEVGSLDEDLDEVARARRSLVVFRSAQKAAKKNWGLPLRSKWLSSDIAH